MIRFCLTLLGLSWLAAFPALALEPQQREVVVTHNRVWDGYKYVENFVPSDHDEIVLMAGGDNAVSFVRTQEYYWPLARQKYVSFETQREELRGSLRIFDGSKLIADVPSSAFSVVYPRGVVNGDASLIWGEDALLAREQYRRDEQEFARAFALARRARTQYEVALKNAAQARLEGQPVEDVPPPPPLPEASLRLVTQPATAYRVNLSPGEYDVIVNVDGADLPETARKLRVIAPAPQELHLVAEVVPEERWTRPIAANAPEDKIYARPGAVFYTTLHDASRYDEADYVAMTRPQAPGVEGRAIWVKRRPSEATSLRVAWNDGTAETLDRTSLKVEQTQGSQFGYVVRQAREREVPDLNAFAIKVPEDGSQRGRVSVEADGKMQLDRQVIVVRPSGGLWVWGLAVLPLVFGMAMQIHRRRAVAA